MVIYMGVIFYNFVLEWDKEVVIRGFLGRGKVWKYVEGVF